MAMVMAICLLEHATTPVSTGRSYVVFGGPGVGNSGLLTLSSLNGINGFKLDGEASGDREWYFGQHSGRYQWRWLWRPAHWGAWPRQ